MGASSMRFKRGKLKILMFFSDAFFINFACFMALALRFDGYVPSQYIPYLLKTMPFATIAGLACFYKFDLYDRLWRFASVNEMISVVWASTATSLLLIALTYMLQLHYPRSVYVLFWLLLTAFTGGYRFLMRVVLGKRHQSLSFAKNGKDDTTNVMIIGAGDASSVVVEEFLRHPSLKRRPVALIDDDKNKLGMKIRGVPVVGTRECIPEVVLEKNVREIIIAIPSADRRDIRDIVEICNKTKCKLKILPGIYELIDDKVAVKRIRDVKIEDLLGREPVKVDLCEISSYLQNKTVMVTGGGGSIGSELCRQVARFKPKELLIYDISENSVYDLEYDLKTVFPKLKYTPIIGSVRDEKKLENVFDKYRPDIVFHAAAHKHVPLMEQNPLEAVKNNVFGTLNLVRAADKYRTQKFILISTDKAVNPTSVMGATKRIAEIIIQIASQNSSTVFSAVRFGNVLGSRGSVVPLFKKQIEAGGPVTVTHPEVIRYFMTIPEAVQLVIQAGAFAKGGEIFILDMGDPVKIDDLAKDMIRLSGLEPNQDIEIKYTGLRPGEKLFEELLLSEEGLTATKNNRIFVARPTHIDKAAFAEELEQLKNILIEEREKDFVEIIRSIVPTFKTLTQEEKSISQ